MFQLPQGRTGVDPQFVTEQFPDPPARVERVGLPIQPVQRGDQLHPELLAQRVLPGQRGQLADDVGVAAAGQIGLDAGL